MKGIAEFLMMTCLCTALQGAYVQVQLPLTQLPQDDAYQRDLRSFLATLSSSDLTVPLAPFTQAEIDDAERAYGLWVLSLQAPKVSAAALPAEGFTLAAIESQKGLALPAAPRECQNLAWLAKWDYPGNPYLNSRALKLRALILAAVDIAMLDYLYDHDPRGADRSDYLGGNLIWIGFTYLHCRDVLTADERNAFEQGIRKLVGERLVKWGPKGLMTDMDLFAPVGLWYVSQALADPAFTEICRTYAEQLFTDEHYFNAAGYFVDNGCFDTSYNGISLYFGSWAALASDWDFTRQAMRQALRLRAHLCFPAPDNTFSGPSAMSSRTSADPAHDQWQFAHRLPAEGMLADESIYRSPLPTAPQMQTAQAQVLAKINQQLAEPAAANPGHWAEAHWSGDLNYAAEHLRPGHYARLLQLQTQQPALFEPLFAGDATFIRAFGRAFVIAKQSGWAAAIHTGPVGRDVGHNGLWYGSGGGQLATFWTPASGVVIANRSRGVQGQVYNLYSEWRSWPVHAVTGITGADELITSGRIQQPDIQQEVGRDNATITAAGEMPMYNKNRTATTPSGIRYQRRFVLGGDELTVTTTVKSDQGAPWLAELNETLPAFLYERASQTPATISFRVGDAWKPGSADPCDAVAAVRIDRFNGAAVITFARPRRVRLAPQVWRDGFQTQAAVHSILVDLTEGAKRGRDNHGSLPAVIVESSVQYTVRAAAAEVPK